MKDKLAEDRRYAVVIEKRKNEPTVSLDDYLANCSEKKKLRSVSSNKIN